jgi:hypothetical protein
MKLLAAYHYYFSVTELSVKNFTPSPRPGKINDFLIAGNLSLYVLLPALLSCFLSYIIYHKEISDARYIIKDALPVLRFLVLLFCFINDI